MKLHDNSRFERCIVVPRTASKFVKTKGQVQGSGRLVGLPDLQKNRTSGPLGKRSPQAARNPLAPKFGRYGEVENLAFAGGQCSRRQESGNPALADRHQEVIL